MPFLDRYWGLRPVFAVAPIAVEVQPIKILLFNDGALDTYINMPLEHIGNILLLGLVIVFLLAFSFIVAMSAIPARRRKRLRLSAIRGNPNAVPLALAVYENTEYDLVRKPVVIEEQYNKGAKWLYLLVAGPFFVAFLVLVAILVVLLPFDTISRLPVSPFTLDEALRLLMLGALVVDTILAIILIFRYLPTIFGRPHGATLGVDGVTYRNELGKKSFLRWDEVRLFEALGAAPFGRVSPPYTYYLYSAHASAMWRDPWPGNESVPTLTSTHGGPALAVKIIHDQTGLAPRTFIKALQAKEQPPNASSPVA